MTTLQIAADGHAPSYDVDQPRPRLVSRALLVRFVSIIGSSIGFYLPLSVVPLVAQDAGSASTAGFATVALLLATVSCELVTPRLVSLVGYRWALALGLLFLGVPAVVLVLVASTPAILAVSVLRGIGFAVCVTAGGAVTASLIPGERRGEGLALVGIVGGIPGMLALPAGVWIAARWGYAPVFVATTVITLVALVSVPGLPSRKVSGRRSDEVEPSVLAGLRSAAIRRPAAIFATSTAAVGVLVTFVPLAVTGAHAWVVAAALLAQPAASTGSRWVAGRIGDRRGQAVLLVPGLLLAVAGMLGVAVIGSAVAVIGGALVFGLGFGVLQNATLCLMFARAPEGSEGVVSAIWNAAYDLGMAAGALGAGLVVAHVGYAAIFALAAVVMVPGLAGVRRDRR
jgi:predicted MFS family arabinose efflux permease